MTKYLNIVYGLGPAQNSTGAKEMFTDPISYGRALIHCSWGFLCPSEQHWGVCFELPKERGINKNTLLWKARWDRSSGMCQRSNNVKTMSVYMLNQAPSYLPHKVHILRKINVETYQLNFSEFFGEGLESYAEMIPSR